ncbi:MAG: nucleotidyltransferase domain-containing protein [Rhodothermaceae bacterium]|nr:nucleotidyltransferase domain-containing protein [Rhodothermaceae bacterium]
MGERIYNSGTNATATTRVTIRSHHQRAIDRLADAYHNDPRFRALIIGGSVAKGYARADSDVDFLIVATDEAFEQHRAARDLFINRRDLCDYEGGFVDGKIINLAFLTDLADKGNEPSRAAFEGAIVAYSHLSGLDALLKRIPVYPEVGHDERIKAFYCMAFMQHWLIHEAERHGNSYALTRGASQLALFTGRLFLAHNRRLFPYHKWLPRALESVPEKPDNLMVCFNDLLEQPGGDRATALFARVRAFRDWGVSDLEAYTWFMTDVEWSWMSGTIPLEDW